MVNKYKNMNSDRIMHFQINYIIILRLTFYDIYTTLYVGVLL